MITEQADASPSSPAAGEPLSFEAALTELEQIVKQLEQGELSLEASLKLYERGRALVAQCTKQLDEAELKIQVLTETLSSADER